MNQNISWGKIAVLVVAIVGIGALGFVVGRQKSEVAVVAPIAPVAQPDKKEAVRPAENVKLVVAPVDWKTYKNEELGFSFNYPENWWWEGVVDIFIIKEQRSVLEIEVENEIKNTPLEHAKEKIQENSCPAQEEGSTAGDHIIRSTDRAVLYVLYCSATSEIYVYEFLNKKNQLIKMTYHDDFEGSLYFASENKKLEKFEKILASIVTY